MDHTGDSGREALRREDHERETGKPWPAGVVLRPIGEHVLIEDSGGPMTGRIAGLLLLMSVGGELVTAYPVELDTPVWSEGRTTFVRVLLCHPGNLSPL